MTDKTATPENEQAEATQAEGTSEQEVSCEEQLQTVTAERDDWQEKALRYAAELENVRKRSEKEVEDAHRYAVTKFARELLAVQDNMERAFESAREMETKDENVKVLLEGIDMVANQLNAALGKMHIERIEAQGKKFDPELHQVMNQVESDEHEPNTVVHELQPGYTIAGRLLRPALVSTAKKSEAEKKAG